ncbi:SHOCT domain-containing protein [Amycolatopsis speibonae]|uniref:SHOCT domain-containing protein n=1 Tax=Amycolatopsis speibonae TaxID=1450224 RepID=A0ABV7PA28_9PSEU
MHYGPSYGSSGWIGVVLMLAIAVIVVAGLVTIAVILLRRYARPASGHDEALRILDERFARGEIDKAEYEERRAAIRS